MNYRHPRHRIHEVVQSPKCLTEDHAFEVKSRGENGAAFDADLVLTDGPYWDIRYLGHAARSDSPEMYDASLLLDQQRVRGVGYCPVGRDNYRAKLRIPKGWHQNLCDPNVSTDHPDWNRHDPLPGFAVTDFGDFIRRVATLWNIDLRREDELL